jgi:type IV pilus assembly protein PilC
MSTTLLAPHEVAGDRNAPQPFRWTARSETTGKKVRGLAQAVDASDLTRDLLDRDLIPLGIRRGRGSVLSRDWGHKKVKHRDLVLTMRMLSSMIGAGLHPTEALEVVERDCADKNLARALADIRVLYSNGSGLSAAFRAQGNTFPAVVLDVIEAGEAAGKVQIAMERAAVHLDKGDELRAKIIKALIQPAIQAAVGLVVTAMIVWRVVPKMVTSFHDLGGPNYQVPGPTVALAHAAKMVPFALLGLALIIGAGAGYYRRVRRQPRVREFVDRLKFSIPLAGTLLHTTAIARFCHTLSLLLRCGVPVLQALELSSRSCGNIRMERAVLATRDAVGGRGSSITAPLREEPLFPDTLVRLIAAGEKSNKIGPMLENAAEMYDRDADVLADALTKAIGPIVGLVISVIIGVIGLLTLYPLTQIGNALDAGTTFMTGH